MYNRNFYRRPPYYNDRLIGGGFAFPFLLGGLTGGLLAPAFGPRPFYPGPPPRPYPYSYPYSMYY